MDGYDIAVIFESVRERQLGEGRSVRLQVTDELTLFLVPLAKLVELLA